jgi:phosphoglycolate phosphatase
MSNGMKIMPNNLRMVVFDCDGTIVDSQRAIVEIMQATFESYNLRLPEREKILLGVGLELSVGIERLLPELHGLDISKLCTTYRKLAIKNRKNDKLGDPLYPDAESVIRRLHADEWLLGIATGKSRLGLDYVLNSYNLSHLFMTKQTSDSAAGKPNPEMLENAMRDTGVSPSNVFMVGDTTYDICMAVNARTRAIGVSWGYHKTEELLDAGAEIVLDNYQDLFTFLQDSSKN